jgi:hypothetical protein
MAAKPLRALDIALATFALRSSAAKPAERQRSLVPAVDDADAATLDRAAIPYEEAALIASLWPPARQCVIAPLYEELPAPAVFGMLYRVDWAAPGAEDARALQERLRRAFH